MPVGRPMIDSQHPLVLASQSPRRLELLKSLRLPVRVIPIEVNEGVKAVERPLAYLERVASAKMLAACQHPDIQLAGAIIVADTIVVIEEQILGKPRDLTEARAMVARLSGREHSVYTRFVLSGTASSRCIRRAQTVETRVKFRMLRDAEVESYACSGEGLDKAGAYAIQGLGGFAVERIEGSYSNVVGLPVCEVVLALQEMGLLRTFPIEEGGL